MVYSAFHPILSVPLFDAHSISLPDYLSQHAGAIFQRWSDWIALRAVQDFRGEGRFDHINRLEDTAVFIDPPYVLNPHNHAVLWDKLKPFETSDSTGGQGYRGTTGRIDRERFARKIYVNPHPAQALDFLLAFNTMVQSENLPIISSKLHNNIDWIRTPSGRAVRAVRHNGYCIYLADDSGVPAILTAVERAATNSEATLLNQRIENYPKAVLALGGLILMGLDLNGDQSFDNWTRPIGWAGFRAVQEILQRHPQSSTEECKETAYQNMVAGLLRVRGPNIDPSQFLSFV